MTTAVDIRELKEKVAMACRLINDSGLGDYSGHVSIRIPGTDHFVINGRLTSRAALNPDDILVCNMQGEKIEGNDLPVSEIAIHTQIFKARADVQSVGHFHPPKAVLFSVVNRPLKPVFLKGSMVGEVPVHDDPRHIITEEQGDALARTLGSGKVALLRGHGAVIAGPSVEGMFFLGVCLEENARRYQEALALGEPKFLSEEEQRDIIGSGYKQERFKKIWDYYLSKLDK